METAITLWWVRPDRKEHRGRKDTPARPDLQARSDPRDHKDRLEPHPAPPDYSFFCGEGFKASEGTSEVGNALDREQIDMSNASAVRFAISVAGRVLPERKLCSGGVHLRRNRLVCTIGRSAFDNAQWRLFKWLAGPADRSERRLLGADCRLQRRDRRSSARAPTSCTCNSIGIEQRRGNRQIDGSAHYWI